MLKDNVLNKLNEQLNYELASAYVYFAMAGYLESINLKGFSNWMKVQAQEEIAHTARIFNYINDKSARVHMTALDAPKNDWSSPLEALEDAYAHECMISEKINDCVTLAIQESDHSTNTFLQWFVAEQVEEEAAADDIVQKLKLIGDNSSGLYLLDTELMNRSFDDPDGGGAAR